jgi:hypothetical protein
MEDGETEVNDAEADKIIFDMENQIKGGKQVLINQINFY